MDLQQSVQQFIEDKKDYYKQWIFEEPIVISKGHNANMQKLQNVMYKLIKEFVVNYEEYKEYMPVSNELERVLAIFKSKEYNIGTYRTDFVYDENHQIKLIEITCRFALNGMFLSGLMNDLAKENIPNNLKGIKTKDQYFPIYQHLGKYLKDASSVCVLKGNDTRNESKIYIDILKRTGLKVIEISFDELEDNLDKLNDALVISELSFDEILFLSDKTLQALALSNLINDFRTVFLIHDKRFFSILAKEGLQKKALTSEEIRFFEKFYIPTYCSNEAIEKWDMAKKNKSEWIIKHRSLGKSQKVYAGIVTPIDEWEAIFESADFEDMTLQKWIPQKTIKGKIGKEEFEDFVTGTLLFFDDNYFGYGDFRTSSHPVTNKVDHRKVAGLILDETIESSDGIENYIA